MTSRGRAASRQTRSLPERFVRDVRKNKYIYLMAIPMLAYYLIFHYMPMYGASIAFKNYVPKLGIMGSPWVGLYHFKSFFNNVYFSRLLPNTLALSLLNLLSLLSLLCLLSLLSLHITRRERCRQETNSRQTPVC